MREIIVSTKIWGEGGSGQADVLDISQTGRVHDIAAEIFENGIEANKVGEVREPDPSETPVKCFKIT